MAALSEVVQNPENRPLLIGRSVKLDFENRVIEKVWIGAVKKLRFLVRTVEPWREQPNCVEEDERTVDARIKQTIRVNEFTKFRRWLESRIIGFFDKLK